VSVLGRREGGFDALLLSCKWLMRVVDESGISIEFFFPSYFLFQ
jgi:hypothetical protein